MAEVLTWEKQTFSALSEYQSISFLHHTLYLAFLVVTKTYNITFLIVLNHQITNVPT